MPVGQELPTRGMGFWARAVVDATSKMKLNRNVRIPISPGMVCMYKILNGSFSQKRPLGL